MYSFSPGTSSRITEMLQLDPETGVLTLVESLKDSGEETFVKF